MVTQALRDPGSKGSQSTSDSGDRGPRGPRDPRGARDPRTWGCPPTRAQPGVPELRRGPHSTGAQCQRLHQDGRWAKGNGHHKTSEGGRDGARQSGGGVPKLLRGLRWGCPAPGHRLPGSQPSLGCRRRARAPPSPGAGSSRAPRAGQEGPGRAPARGKPGRVGRGLALPRAALGQGLALPPLPLGWGLVLPPAAPTALGEPQGGVFLLNTRSCVCVCPLGDPGWAQALAGGWAGWAQLPCSAPRAQPGDLVGLPVRWRRGVFQA